MKAQILSYSVKHSKKRLLLIGNGHPSDVFGIQIGKTFQKQDAQKIIDIIKNGQF